MKIIKIIILILVGLIVGMVFVFKSNIFPSFSNQLNISDIRAGIDDRNEKIGRKIRDNEIKRIPYLLIVGEKEFEQNTVAVRRQGEGDQGSMTIDEFSAFIDKEVSEQLADAWK